MDKHEEFWTRVASEAEKLIKSSKKTNFDRIKSMNIDEMELFLCGLLADFMLCKLDKEPMRSPNKNWLESEVTSND